METSQRIAAVRKVLRDHQVEEHRVKGAGPACSGCLHALERTVKWSAPVQICGHLAYTKRQFDPTAARFTEALEIPSSAARAEDGLCGIEGLLFEPKAGPVKVWFDRASALLGILWLAGMGYILLL